MGADRFQCYKAAAEVVAKKGTWNSVLKIEQPITVSANDVHPKLIRSIQTKKKEESQEEEGDGQAYQSMGEDLPMKRPATSPAERGRGNYYKRSYRGTVYKYRVNPKGPDQYGKSSYRGRNVYGPTTKRGGQPAWRGGRRKMSGEGWSSQEDWSGYGEENDNDSVN